MVDFVFRSDVTAIRRALAKMIGEQIEAAMEDRGFTEELYAAARTGDVASHRAVLKAKVDELSASADRLVAAARAEIDALPRVVIPDEG